MEEEGKQILGKPPTEHTKVFMCPSPIAQCFLL